MSEPQSAHHVLMIRPQRFAGNPETAASKRFQDLSVNRPNRDQAAALQEFDALAEALRNAGVHTHIFEDTLEPHTPDSIFPNNWVSFHADGAAVLYPMMAPNRRLERRMDVLQSLSSDHGFRITRTIDLSPHESKDKFLEGTGSLVLDRVYRVAYACISPRTDLDVLGDFAQQLDYDLVTFEAFDNQGAPIYHTNVLMCVGTRFAVVCSAAIADRERTAVLETLRGTGHTVIDISPAQMYAYAGNMLELRNDKGASLVAMSLSAFESLDVSQKTLLEQLSGPLIAAAIPTIERLGGGSVRCMLAEIFLPRKA